MSELSAEKKAFNKAWVAAWAELPTIAKGHDVDTGKFSYSYASLPDILEQVRPVLASHGLAVAQTVDDKDGDVAIWTAISHVDGWDQVFGPTVMSAGNTPQQTGSAITYARRYALTAALGIAPDEDDDAASVEPRINRREQSAPRPPDDPHEAAWQETLTIMGRANAGSTFMTALKAAGVKSGERADEAQAALVVEFVKTQTEE